MTREMNITLVTKVVQTITANSDVEVTENVDNVVFLFAEEAAEEASQVFAYAA